MNMRRLLGMLAIVSSTGVVMLACGGSSPADQTGDEQDQTAAKDCDISKTQCEIPVPQCPAGQTPSVDANGFCFGRCVPITQCAAGTFDCHQGGPAICEIVPPTCPAGQTLTTRNGCFGGCVPSNVCKGSAPAPSAKTDCDISKTKCEITVPHCPDGQTPSVDADGFCFGKCVPIAQCAPKTFNCHQGGPAICEIVPPRCASGQTLTTRDGCFGPCVDSSVCK